MTPTPTHVINTISNQTNIRRYLHVISKMLDFMSNLKKMEDFYKSSTWANIKDTEYGHNIAYDFVKSLFEGSKVKVLFTNNGVPTHDDDNLFSTLTTSQIDFIKSVEDHDKICGEELPRKEPLVLYRSGNLISMRTGSATTLYNEIMSGEINSDVMPPDVVLTEEETENLKNVLQIIYDSIMYNNHYHSIDELKAYI